MSELTINARTVGRPFLHWKDSLRDTLKQSNIATTTAARHRNWYMKDLYPTMTIGERNATKRAHHHAARNATPSASQDTYKCQHCGRTCSSPIGILRTWHMIAIIVLTGSITTWYILTVGSPIGILSHERACNKQRGRDTWQPSSYWRVALLLGIYWLSVVPSASWAMNVHVTSKEDVTHDSYRRIDG